MKKYYILLASLIIAILGLAQLGEAQSAAPLTVTEVDGSPTRTGIRKLVVSNGTLTISGQTATVSTGGGGGGGSVNVNGGSVSSPDFNGTTPAAPAGAANVVYQVSGSNVSGYIDATPLRQAANIAEPGFSTDFAYGAADSFTVSLIASGTQGSGGGASATHPGVVFVNSSTSANSGAFYGARSDAMIIGGGERFDVIFRTWTSASTVILRFGANDSTTGAVGTDVICLEMNNSFDMIGRTTSNSVSTTTGTIATLSASTWYHGIIQVNPSATQVDFSVYSEAGALLGTQSSTTNIPTGAARASTVRSSAISTGTTAITLCELDYIGFSYTKALARGYSQ